MKAFLKFIRLPNLIIVGIVAYTLLHTLLYPMYRMEGINPTMNTLQFFLYTVDIILITLGGNIINDIVDEPIDTINRPDTVFVGKYISVPKAYMLYSLVLFASFGISTYLAIQRDSLHLLWIQPLASLLLHFYSTHFKKQAFIGNLVVSLFSGLVSFMILLAEWKSYIQLSSNSQIYLAWAFGLYGLFGFLTTLIREIVKDIEDIEGDAKEGCKTLAIVWGIPRTKNITLGIGVLTLGIIGILSYAIFEQNSTQWWRWLYPMLLIFTPLAYLLFQLYKATHTANYHSISSGLKWIMLMGLLYLFLL